MVVVVVGGEEKGEYGRVGRRLRPLSHRATQTTQLGTQLGTRRKLSEAEKATSGESHEWASELA